MADPLATLAQLHVDAVTTTSPPAFGATSRFFGPDRILSGSDCPYVPIEATAGGLRGLGLDDATLEAIGAGNARALLRPDADA